MSRKTRNHSFRSHVWGSQIRFRIDFTWGVQCSRALATSISIQISQTIALSRIIMMKDDAVSTAVVSSSVRFHSLEYGLVHRITMGR